MAATARPMDTATAAVVASPDEPRRQHRRCPRDTYNSVESLTGSAFADTPTGNAGINSIIGGLGDDKVFGLAGNDNLFGQDGNDVLVGGAGADAFSGGVGSDTASYEDATAGIIAKPGVSGGKYRRCKRRHLQLHRKPDRFSLCRHAYRQQRGKRDQWWQRC